MKRKLTTMLVLVAAAMALTATAASSASAASWHVGGTELLSSESLASATEATHIKIGLGVNAPAVECEGATQFASSSIAHPNKATVGHIILNECAITGGSCFIENPTIESKPLTAEAALGSVSPEDTLLLKPEAGTTFMEFKLSGASCALLGTVRITGQAKFIMPKGREELAAQTLEFHAGAKELSRAGNEVTLSGSAKVKLSSGKAWSFR